MDSDNLQPPAFGPTWPIYPPLAQLARVTAGAISGTNIYPAVMIQIDPETLESREREAVYITEPNGIALGLSIYDCRIVGAFQGVSDASPIPLLATTCCTPGGPEPSSSSSSMSPSSGGGNVQTGSIFVWPGSSAPAGALACDGTAYSQSQYPALFAVIGSTWNTHRGQSAPAAGFFRVPLMNGLTVAGVGAAASNPTTSTRTLAQTVGEETHTLSNTEMPSHSHSIEGGANFLDNNIANNVAGGTFLSLNVGPQTTDAFGGGGAHNNIQPTVAMLWVIQT